MPFKIVRNDLTKMQVDAIVNTANEAPAYGAGTDYAVYTAAGKEELLRERKKIGYMKEGEVAITPGFRLPAKYIIHAVSPQYIDGNSKEEKKLRYCYQKSLILAHKNGCKSIAFPLIATGSFGYPKEEGMRIAIDEINAFLLKHEMLIYLVVFDEKSTELALRLNPALEAYIDQHYVSDVYEKLQRPSESMKSYNAASSRRQANVRWNKECYSSHDSVTERNICREDNSNFEYFEVNQSALNERMKHLSDTFQEYLFYLIQLKGMTNPEVYKRAIITKQTFAKIKKNPNYHPDKGTAMRLCIGTKLSLDETKDLLARAGYALSPCDKRDIIFQFFIENKAYDMIAIDIALEEHGLPCFIE